MLDNLGKKNSPDDKEDKENVIALPSSLPFSFNISSSNNVTFNINMSKKTNHLFIIVLLLLRCKLFHY